MSLILLFLLCSPLIYADDTNIEEAKTDTLRLVHAVWRHGDRTPSSLLPGDLKNNLNSWVIGLGELTKLGAQQEFRLGQFIRKRYEKFISSDYSPYEIYVRSSDYNRTLASGQAVMLGLYSKAGEMNLNPVPIHTVPKSIDNLMYDRLTCPVADTERERVYSSNHDVIKIAKENLKILEYLGNNSGLGNVPLNVRQMWFVYDPLNAIVSHPETHSLPDWVNETIKDEIWRLYDISSSYLYHTDLLKKLRGGPIFNDMIQRMLMRKNESLDKRFRFYGYSGHDTTIAALLGAFGITLKQFPKYSTALFIELHYEKNDYYVHLFYKNETDSPSLISLDIPECSPNCRLDDLISLRQHIIPSNWEFECGIKSWYNINEDKCFYLSLFCLVLFIFLFIHLTVNYIKCPKKQPKRVNELELKVEMNKSESGVHLLSDSDDSEI